MTGLSSFLHSLIIDFSITTVVHEYVNDDTHTILIQCNTTAGDNCMMMYQLCKHNSKPIN